MSTSNDHHRYRVGISFEGVDPALGDAILRACFAEPFGPGSSTAPAPAAAASPAPPRRWVRLGRGDRSARERVAA